MRLFNANRVNVGNIKMVNGSRSIVGLFVGGEKVAKPFQAALDDLIEVFVLDMLSLPDLF
jgi:hypothetical protein